MNEKIEIINTGESPATTILLNGVDISDLVSEVCFRQTGGEFPTVQLNFVAGAVHIHSYGVVQYPQKFFDALMADKHRIKADALDETIEKANLLVSRLREAQQIANSLSKEKEVEILNSISDTLNNLIESSDFLW